MQDRHFQATVKLITCLALLVFMPQPALSQSTLNLSQDLVQLGIASTNMVPNQPSLDAGPLLTQGIEYAKAHNIGLVVANPGSYYFLSLAWPYSHVQLFAVDNITVDLQGSELIFTHPLQGGIYLGYTTEAVFQNFTVDYQPLTFTQVRVTSVNAAQAQIQYAVDGAWQDPMAFNNAQLTPGAETLIVEVHVFRNGQPAVEMGGRIAAQYPFTAGTITLLQYDVQVTPANVSKIRVGDTAVLTMRSDFAAIMTDRCTGCTLRNIRIYSSPASGIDAHFSPSSTLERIYVIPKPGTDRLVPGQAGIVFQASGPNNAIRLSRAIRTVDDGFGLYSWITGTVQSQIGNRQVVVQGTPNSSLSWLVTVPVGSPVVFQRALDGATLASAVVTSQSALASTVTFTLDRDLPSGLVGSAFYSADLNMRGANSTIERNTVQYQSLCCSAIDISGWSGSTVRGNYIRRSAFAGISGMQNLEENPTNWQTTPMEGMTFSGNVIDGANRVSTGSLWWLALGGLQMTTLRKDQNGFFTLMPTGPHQNVSMTGNFVAYPGRAALWAGNTTGGTVTGNGLLHPNDRPDLANTGAYPPLATKALLPIAIDQSIGVTSGNNTIDDASSQVFVTDTQFRELAAYAPGSAIRLNAYNLGSISNPIVSLTDADGHVLPVTIQSTTAQALDVQLPSSSALGAAYLTLTATNAKYFGTLFIDSQDNIPAVNGCTYEASLSSTPVTYSASSLRILVVTQAGCSYPVLASDPFVSPGGSGTGTAVISLRVAANTGPARSAIIEIAGQPITVTQSAINVGGPFTDADLNGVSVKAVHIGELRVRIDALRALKGLPLFPWTDPVLDQGSTAVRATHVQDLRAALNQAFVAAGRPVPQYTDATITAGSTPVRVVHVTELRSAVIALEQP